MPSSHFVLTLGRSGSNTLVDMLNQHPAVLNFGEVLGDWTKIRRMQRQTGLFRDDDAAYLDAILGNKAILRAANAMRSFGKLRAGRRKEVKRLRQVETVGVKEFSLNLKRAGLAEFLRERPAVKVVGLVRRNVIERMISNEMLRATGVVAARAGEEAPKRRRLELAVEDVLEKLAVIEAENRDLVAMLDALPAERVLRLDYATLFAAPERTEEIMKKIYAFLGVSDYLPAVRMKKIVQRDPLETLENGDEVRAAIENSRFASHLLDPEHPAGGAT